MTNYVSWIKVKGIDLLPPVITEKRRIELQRYRQQAIKLEKRLKNCRELKKNLEELLNLQPLTDRPQSEITFRDDTHIEALGIAEKDKVLLIPSKSKRKVKLSKDIIDVTQYNNDGIKIIYNDLDANYVELNQGYQLNLDDRGEKYEVDTSLINTSQMGTISEPANGDYWSEGHKIQQQCPLLNLSKLNESNETDNISLKRMKNHSILSDRKNSSPDKSPRPRLIRSNSYTLESPSPILLAHLEKSNKENQSEGLEQFKELSFARNWSSLENNYVPFENSEYSSINTVYNLDEGNSSSKKNITLNTPEPKENDNINFEKSSPTIEVIQTDISVQQITVNTNDIVNEMDNLDEENKFKHVCDISDPNSQLMKVLQSMPENYSKQIIELIQKQMLNQQQKDIGRQFSPETLKRNLSNTRLKNRNDKNSNVIQEKSDLFTEAQEDVRGNTHRTVHIPSSKSDLSNTNINLQNESQYCSLYQNPHLSDSEKLLDSSISMSPSQSFHFSMTSSDTLRPSSSSSLQLIDLEFQDSKTDNGKFDSSEKCRKEFNIEEEMKGMNVSRKLFPQFDVATMNIIKQEWAASIIGAHVKGYLTRRLLKTERVQTLIDTIKDALMCALQLHSAENIDESDVELHRRLINQVSAACYAFHDIFFSLSVQEQMSVISTDRLRKMEKAKRPSSTSSARRSRSSSSHGSSKQSFQPHSQSLTKV